MNEKFNSRKWVAFTWFMVLATLAIILGFVSMFMHIDYPKEIIDILTLACVITSAYCGFNVLNKRVTTAKVEETEKSKE